MNNTVSLLNMMASFLAIFTASLTSLIPDVVAESLTNLLFLLFLQFVAIMFTRLVCSERIWKYFSVE